MSNTRLSVIALTLTIVAIGLAAFAASAGQSASRVTGMTEIYKGRFYWQYELAQAKLDHAGPEKIAVLQKIVDEHNGRGLPSYRMPDRLFTQWDGYRYEEIAEEGYHYHQPSDSPAVKNASVTTNPATGQRRLKNVVWYPLYPMLGWCVKTVSGIPTRHALTLISWMSILIAAVITAALARNFWLAKEGGGAGDEGARRRADLAAIGAVVLLIFNPCAIFLYANFTESLFTLLLVSFLYCVQQRWFWRAALVAAVASACRSQGVLFGPILALVYLLKGSVEEEGAGQLMRGRFERLPVAIALGCVSAVGLLGYVTYLQVSFHEPFAFMAAQKNWNVGINGQTLREAMNPLRAAGFFLWRLLYETPTDFPRLWETFCLLWPPVLLLVYRKKLKLEWAIVGWILWALPYVSNSLAGNPPEDSKWMSMGRFTAVQVPLFIMLGGTMAVGLMGVAGSRRLCGRCRWVSPWVLLPGTIALFTLFAYKFGAGEWIG